MSAISSSGDETTRTNNHLINSRRLLCQEEMELGRRALGVELVKVVAVVGWAAIAPVRAPAGIVFVRLVVRK